MPRPEHLSRERTAELLKRLRRLSREQRTLREAIEKAEHDVLTQHSRAVHPVRSRTRK